MSAVRRLGVARDVAVGVGRESWVPSPIWPRSLLPQHCTAPDRRIPQLELPPVRMTNCKWSWRPTTTMRCVDRSSWTPPSTGRLRL